MPAARMWGRNNPCRRRNVISLAIDIHAAGPLRLSRPAKLQWLATATTRAGGGQLLDVGAGVPAPVAADGAAVHAEIEAGDHLGVVGGEEDGGAGVVAGAGALAERHALVAPGHVGAALDGRLVPLHAPL